MEIYGTFCWRMSEEDEGKDEERDEEKDEERTGVKDEEEER